MLFEDVISEVGEFGPYQKRIYCLVCFLSIPTSMHILGTVFIQATPSHRCALTWLPNDTYKSQGSWHDAMVKDSIPWEEENGRFDTCSISRSPANLTNGTIYCDKWVYSKHTFRSTFVTDADLVCGDQSLATYASMLMMTGMLSGSFIMGILSDMIGRKKVMILGAVGQCAIAFATAGAKSYPVYATLRFLITFFGIGMFLSGFVIAIELVGPSKRKFVGIVIQMFWCIGLFIETGIAYGLRDWRHFQLAISMFSVVAVILYSFLLPESARWLLQKGRTKEAAKIIQTVAHQNGVVLSDHAKNLVEVDCGRKVETIWKMFASPILVFRSLIVLFNWFAASIVYYGLNLKAGDLSGDIYLNFFLLALVEFLSYFFCLAWLDVKGRKFLQCTSMVTGGVACIATLFPVLYWGDDERWMTLTLALVGKFGISAGFAIICVYSAELFPTVMRNSAIGFCSVSARIGGILAPYIAKMEDIIGGNLGVAVPLIIFGGLSLSAGVLVLFLPETCNKVLPDTLEEAKNFGRSSGSRAERSRSDKDGAGQAEIPTVTCERDNTTEEKQRLLRTHE
ncbi:hypothetical protein RRG08_038910 [Elysia crispata]|uniref:Major facilitator superfamily (MFS) profile domain-containing protein n=1 Tax=Elysia crispata TaxID=231223 RepID=A0AAE0Y8E8_9GAST|nr:hypothetical protein RRG08_038910 [Elysia crispata]